MNFAIKSKLVINFPFAFICLFVLSKGKLEEWIQSRPGSLIKLILSLKMLLMI